MFGDFEPEDAWDALDARPDLINNLFARIALLDGGPTFRVRRGDPLDELAERLNKWLFTHGAPSAREQLRADQLADDIDYLRGRDG